MQKIIRLFLCLLLCFPSYTATAANIPAYLKIGLFFDSTAKESVTFQSDSGFVIGFGEDTGFAEAFTIEEMEITVTKSDSGSFLIGGNEFDSGGEMSVKTVSGTIKVDGAAYRGFVCMRRINGGNINVINVVDIEQYLYSVVGKEMSPSWNIEALKAQAVCARTYALTHLSTYKNFGIDLCTTQYTQVYTGISSETESTIAAVNATRGQTVKYGGKTVEVYYFSSGGGSTEDSKNVWVGDLPYLKGVVDPYENPNEATRYYWTTSVTNEELKNRMISLGYNIGDIVSISVDERSENGRAIKLTITGTAGSKTAERSAIRSLLSPYVHSQQFDVIGEDGGGALDINGNRVNGSYFALSGSGISKIAEGSYSVLSANGSKSYNTSAATGSSFTFEGRGWGHSVGMSQWGAKAMADSGFNYIDILKFYFTGIEVS
jgi:stage II sporulation protein D